MSHDYKKAVKSNGTKIVTRFKLIALDPRYNNQYLLREIRPHVFHKVTDIHPTILHINC